MLCEVLTISYEGVFHFLVIKLNLSSQLYFSNLTKVSWLQSLEHIAYVQIDLRLSLV